MKKEKDHYYENNPWGGRKVYFSDEKVKYSKPSIFMKILTYGVILLVLLLMAFIVYVNNN